MEKKKEENTPTKKRADKYNQSRFAINGSFDQVIKAAFAKDKKPKEAK